MNIVIPMAGDSGKLIDTTHSYTGNFVEINRKPVFQWVCESLKEFFNENFIFIVSKKDVVKYHINASLKLLVPKCTIISLEGETAGAACSVLLSSEYIDNKEELLIYNGKQVIDIDLLMAINYFRNQQMDGGIVTFNSVHPRWSYVKIDKDGWIVEAAEKTPISNIATAGCYYFRNGLDFVKSAKRMIMKDGNVDGKYYVCPVYNEMILRQKKIGCYDIDVKNYFQLTTDKEINTYEEYVRSKV